MYCNLLTRFGGDRQLNYLNNIIHWKATEKQINYLKLWGYKNAKKFQIKAIAWPDADRADVFRVYGNRL